MSEDNITRLFARFDDLKEDLIRVQQDCKYLVQQVNEMQAQNRERDEHIHRLEIAKKQAWAVAGVLGFIVGLIFPVLSKV